MYRVSERGPWLTEGLSERRDKSGRRRELVVVIEARCIRYRPKGTRQEFRITHEKAYELAVAAHVAAKLASKPKRKRGVSRGKI